MMSKLPYRLTRLSHPFQGFESSPTLTNIGVGERSILSDHRVNLTPGAKPEPHISHKKRRRERGDPPPKKHKKNHHRSLVPHGEAWYVASPVRAEHDNTTNHAPKTGARIGTHGRRTAQSQHSHSPQPAHELPRKSVKIPSKSPGQEYIS